MPNVSQAQRAAMAAAAAGKSNIGIPKKVGKEFMAADPGGKLPAHAPKHAGGGEVKPFSTGHVLRPYALGGYIKGGDMAEQLDRARGGPAATTRSRFYKNYPDVFRTSIEEQDYDKPKAAHKRPAGEGKIESSED